LQILEITAFLLDLTALQVEQQITRPSYEVIL
jgi:hypothetical protein